MSALRVGGSRHDRARLELRAATQDDIDAVVALERASFSDPWARSSFTGLLDDPRVYFVVACAGDAGIAGYLAAWFVVPEGEIATLAVAPQSRRHGIGAQLLDSAIHAARVRGVSDLYLEVRESNTPARRLYSSRGFEEIGNRRSYYRNPVEDAIVLRLEVAG